MGSSLQFVAAFFYIVTSQAVASSISINHSEPSHITVTNPVLDQFGLDNTAVTPRRVSEHSSLAPGLWVPSGWSFSIGLQVDTFSLNEDGHAVDILASLDGGSPLPYWIQFDNSNMVFDGISPALEQRQTWVIELFPSSLGHSSPISQFFNLTVALHELSLRSPISSIDVTWGIRFDVSLDDIILPRLLYDQRPLNIIEESAITYSLGPNTPSWLEYNRLDKSVYGIPPLQANLSTTIVLIIRGMSIGSSSPLRVEIPVITQPSYFTDGVVEPIQIRPHSIIDLDLTSYVRNASVPLASLGISYWPETGSSWFSLATSPLRLKGTVPASMSRGGVNVTLTAISNNNSTSILRLNLMIKSHRSLVKLFIGLVIVAGFIAVLAGCLVYHLRVLRRRRVGVVKASAQPENGGASVCNDLSCGDNDVSGELVEGEKSLGESDCHPSIVANETGASAGSLSGFGAAPGSSTTNSSMQTRDSDCTAIRQMIKLRREIRDAERHGVRPLYNSHIHDGFDELNLCLQAWDGKRESDEA